MFRNLMDYLGVFDYIVKDYLIFVRLVWVRIRFMMDVNFEVKVGISFD